MENRKTKEMNMKYTRNVLVQRHRLSQQQADRWLNENRSVELVQDKLNKLNYLKDFVFLTDCLKDHGFLFVCIKGPTLSYRIYNDATVRFSHDVDLLIRPNQLDEVLALLLANNFLFIDGNIWPSSKIEQKLIAKAVHHLSLYHKYSKFCVEIHWTLMHGVSINQNELEKIVYSNLTVINFANREFSVMNRELELLYLMIHGARHGWCRLKWLVDINDYPMDGIDFSLLQKLIKELNAERIVSQTDYFLRQYFNKGLPFEVQAELPNSLINVAQEFIDREDVDPHSFKALFEGFWYRLYLFPQWSYKWRLLKNLSLRTGDIADCHFSFEILYYIYRPISFIRRRVLHV